MEQKTANCVIQWKNTKEKENVLISLDGHDNDNIFFICDSEDEFFHLCKTDGFDDFSVIEHDVKKKMYAPIDNKNLLEDGFEDDLFVDLMPAVNHRKNNVRHLIGHKQITMDKSLVCDAIVEAKWHFGDAAITIKMLACCPFCDDEEEQWDVLFKDYERKFKEMEKCTNENLFEGESFHIGIERNENEMHVSFWYEED